MPSARINLKSASSATPPIQVPPGATKITYGVKDDSTTTWGTAVVSLQWSAEVGFDDTGTDLESWQAFSPVVTLTTSTKARRNVGISGTPFIRFLVSTAGLASDPKAMLTWRFA